MEMPSFLQSKQNMLQSGSKLSTFLKNKNQVSIISLVILLLAIPLTVWLLQKTQIFAPKAEVKPIELVTGVDSCVISTDPNKVSCASFPIKLTSPLGPKPTSSPHIEPGATCTADNQCREGEKCFNFQDFPGSCKPEGTQCAQAVTRACHERSSCNDAGACTNVGPECIDFPTPCRVPPGWTIEDPTRSPSPSPSVSPSASSAACNPRPNISHPAVMTAQGQLVTLTPATSSLLPNNPITQLKFTRLANGTVTIGGVVHNAPFIYTVPAGSTQIQFLVKQVTYGQSTTVELFAVDSCGNYSLFYGGGTGAGWPNPNGAASPSPSPSASLQGTGTVTVSPTTIARGGTINLAWQYVNLTPSSNDYFETLTSTGVHAQNIYIGSCSAFPTTTTTAATGQCPLATQNYGSGSYIVKFFRSGVATPLSTATFSVTGSGADNSILPQIYKGVVKIISDAFMENQIVTPVYALTMPTLTGASVCLGDTPRVALSWNSDQNPDILEWNIFREPAFAAPFTNSTVGNYTLPFSTPKVGRVEFPLLAQGDTSGTYTYYLQDQVSSTNSNRVTVTNNATCSNNSQLVEAVVPASVQPGAQFNVKHTFKNTGTRAWPSSSTVSYDSTILKLVSSTPFSPISNELKKEASGIPLSLYPGQTYTFEFLVTAPTAPGTYEFKWQLNSVKKNGFFDTNPTHTPFGEISTKQVVVTGTAASPSPSVSPSPSPTAAASPSPAVCTNLVKNFSFENPAVVNTTTSNGWQVYGAPAASTTAVTENIPDWDPRGASAPYQVELHKALKGPAAEALQYAEIDAPGIVTLTQSIPTQAGAQYQIKFSYSSRPDITTAQKLGVYWNGTQVGTIDGTTHGPTGTDWKEKTFTVAGVAGTSKLGFGALADSSAGAGNFIDNISVTQTSGVCGPNTSPSPSPSGEVLPGTAFYKMAETEIGLSTAARIGYDNHPTITNFTFSDMTPGTKQIWVEFIGADDSPGHSSIRREHISVELAEPEPVVTSLDCSMDISRQNLKLTINGSHLGTSSGKVTANSKDAQILTWNQNQVLATIKPEDNLEEGKEFKVILTKDDGKIFPEITCMVNTTLISLGARLFCREPGKFDTNDVKVTLVDENGNKVNEEVTIDAHGVMKGLKTKFQVGKRYAISIKAPFSLRRNSIFTAANGTNIVTPEDGTVFILPVGDIAPVILNDGKINTLDRSEIVRQWSVLGNNTRSGDFNRDTKVNSIDWACMRYDFNKEDEAVPDKASLPSVSPSPASSLTPVSSPSHAASSSPLVSATPHASGQRAGYFLLEPVEGGSYPNGDEFIVNINVWSQNEAANLFVAKLSYDPSSLEVMRIEKGTVLTSWAEEFFDNQTGQISLVAGLPRPGLKTTEGNDPLMAKVIFKSKKVGNTEISVTADSRIYSNSDNSNILTSLLSAQIAITN